MFNIDTLLTVFTVTGHHMMKSAVFLCQSVTPMDACNTSLEMKNTRGGYLPQVLVPTVKRTPKAVAVTSIETEER